MIYKNAVHNDILSAKGINSQDYPSAKKTYYREPESAIEESISALRTAIIQIPNLKQEFLQNYKLDIYPKLIYVPYVHVSASASSGELYYGGSRIGEDAIAEYYTPTYKDSAGDGSRGAAGFPKGLAPLFNNANWKRKYQSENAPVEGSLCISASAVISDLTFRTESAAKKEARKEAYSEINRRYGGTHGSMWERIKGKAQALSNTNVRCNTEIAFLPTYLIKARWNDCEYKFYVFPETMTVMFDETMAYAIKNTAETIYTNKNMENSSQNTESAAYMVRNTKTADSTLKNSYKTSGNGRVAGVIIVGLLCAVALGASIWACFLILPNPLLKLAESSMASAVYFGLISAGATVATYIVIAGDRTSAKPFFIIFFAVGIIIFVVSLVLMRQSGLHNLADKDTSINPDIKRYLVYLVIPFIQAFAAALTIRIFIAVARD